MSFFVVLLDILVVAVITSSSPGSKPCAPSKNNIMELVPLLLDLVSGSCGDRSRLVVVVVVVLVGECVPLLPLFVLAAVVDNDDDNDDDDDRDGDRLDCDMRRKDEVTLMPLQVIFLVNRMP